MKRKPLFVGRGLWSLEYNVKRDVKLLLKRKPFEAEKEGRQNLLKWLLAFVHIIVLLTVQIYLKRSIPLKNSKD
jgi:hypothetical protein